jgi:hypothetical protein
MNRGKQDSIAQIRQIHCCCDIIISSEQSVTYLRTETSPTVIVGNSSIKIVASSDLLVAGD